VTRRGPRRRQRGIALLLVLWVFTILGVLALDFSRYMRDDAMASVNFADETHGYYIALGGMNRAMWDAMRLREQGPEADRPVAQGTSQQTRNQDDPNGLGGPHLGMQDDDIMPADGQWHDGELAGAKYQVRITDEGGLIPINKVGEAILKKVVQNLMVGPQSQVKGVDRRAENEVEGVVDSILDWRDPDSLKRVHGAESEYYLSTKGGYPAKNAFFDDPQELLLVKGVDASLYYGGDGVPGLRDVISIFNRSGQLNARTVTAPVLQALLGIEADDAEQLIEQRDADPEGFVTILNTQLGGLGAEEGETLSGFIVNEPAHTVRIQARADTSQPRNQSNVEAVVELSSDEFDGPKILRWLDRAPWDGLPPTGIVPGDTTS
jgi:general secretion pathway protein K